MNELIEWRKKKMINNNNKKKKKKKNLTKNTSLKKMSK